MYTLCTQEERSTELTCLQDQPYILSALLHGFTVKGDLLIHIQFDFSQDLVERFI